jgi:hypothetical protein
MDDNDDNKAKMGGQIQALLGAAETHSIQVAEARKKFEKLSEYLLSNMGFEDSQARENIRISFENLYTFGCDAGSASETALAIREQLDFLMKMSKKSDADNKARVEREVENEKQRTERDERSLALSEKSIALSEQALALSERECKALEVLAASVKKSG